MRGPQPLKIRLQAASRSRPMLLCPNGPAKSTTRQRLDDWRCGKVDVDTNLLL